MYCTRRKRLQLSRVLFLLSGLFLCTVYQLTISARVSKPLSVQIRDAQIGEDPAEGSTWGVEEAAVETQGLEEPITATHKLELTDQTTPQPHSPHDAVTTLDLKTSPTTEAPLSPATNRTFVHCIYVAPEPPQETPTPLPLPPVQNTTPDFPGEAPQMKGDYPRDIFSIEDRRRGWVTLHIFGMMYMFVSLAIVCDEFFVPVLGVITDKLAISNDVAGATFMAAGGSAPELFTSLIGVFIAHSNVGIGTIVGSAVFNILFVIGMCALVSREMLHLTWWPLFRDMSFYIFDLILLIVFFLDNVIMWWESITLVAAYTLYVIFMKFNVQLERAFKSLPYNHKNLVKIIAVEEPEKVNDKGEDNHAPPAPDDNNQLKVKPPLQRGRSSASLHNSTMRNTIYQLMIHTLNPLGSNVGKLKEKAETLNSVASGNTESKPQAKTEDEKKPEQPKEPVPSPVMETEKKEEPEDKQDDYLAGEAGSGGSGHDDGSDDEDSDDDSDDDSEDDDDDEEEEEEKVAKEAEEEELEENDKPLSLDWPDTPREQATYLFLLPIVFPLWLTVPDVRNPTSKKFFVVTFLGSILWIAVFSYLMVWWAHQVGETIGISEEIMGLTILAAGTSIPDLITSVIVARKGQGDMAVSSSVGSNIFDITVGLPVPWLLYSLSHGLAPVQVSSNGLFCAIVMLFLMLLFVIITIVISKWKMNKLLGATMFLLYIVFLVLSVMLEDRIIVCPVSI